MKNLKIVKLRQKSDHSNFKLPPSQKKTKVRAQKFSKKIHIDNNEYF